MNDELLFKDIELIEKHKLPYCLINNTLLSLYRDGRCFDAPERECVLLMPSENRFYVRYNLPVTMDILGSSSLGNINLEGKVAINFMTEINGLLVINPYHDYFFVIPKDIIYPFREFTYKNKIIYIPHKPEDYLELFYGDWRTPVSSSHWNWVTSKSVIRANSINEALQNYHKQHDKT